MVFSHHWKDISGDKSYGRWWPALSILPYNVQFLIMSEHSHNCGFKYFMTQKLSQNNKKCKLDVKFQNYEIKPFPILLRVLPLLNAFLCI